MESFDFLLLAIGYLSIFSYGFVDNIRGPIFPDLLHDFGLNDSIGALFFLVASTAALVANLTAPIWLKRMSLVRAVQMYSVFMLLGLILYAWAPSFTVVLIGALGVGAALGGLGILVNLLVSEASPVGKRRRSLSGLHSCYGVASLLSPILATAVYHMGFSWPGVFGILIAGPTAVLILTFFHKTDPKQDKSVTQELRSTRPPGLGLSAAMGLALALTGAVVAEVALSTRLALYARRDLGMGLESANNLLAEFFGAYVIGRVLMAFVHVNLRTEAILVMTCVGACFFSALGLFGHPYAFLGAGFSVAIFYPFAMSFVNEQFGNYSAWVVSLCQGMQSVGIIAMNFFIGGFSDRFGLGRALWLAPAALLYSIIYFGLKLRRKPA